MPRTHLRARRTHGPPDEGPSPANLNDAPTLDQRKPFDVAQEFDINVIWQWNNYKESCIGTLYQAAIGDDATALRVLKSGQPDNEHAQVIYELAHDNWKWGTWTRVAKLSYSPPDFTKFRVNLEWQWQNNIESVRDAHNLWTLFDPSNPEQEMGGFYYLLTGQRHDADAMNGYRACYNKNSDLVHQIVASYFPSRVSRRGKRR